VDFNSSQFHHLVKEFKLNDIMWIVSNKDRKSLGASMPDNATVYDVEEIVSMILKNAKQLAEKAAGEALTDCVIAIPPQFNTRQRIALLDAAKLAGFNPIAFINENLAGAIRYAIDVGVKEKNITKVMYINMGASSFKVTIVSHSKVTDPDTKKLADRIEIIGEAWDDTFGGRQFDYEVVDLMADTFNGLPARKGKADIKLNAKAMRRILEKAEDLKEKMSAGKLIRVFIDNLADYVSYTVIFSKTFFIGEYKEGGF
jgi:molecular chaperone DnaK (HSP70)